MEKQRLAYENAIRSTTDESAIVEVKKLFKFLDKDNTNSVKIKRINKLWKAFGCIEVKKTKSGRLQFLPFLGYFIAISSDIFCEYDKNEKGYLLPSDLVLLGDKYLDKNIDLVFFQGADVDGNHQISFGEFLTHMSKLCIQKVPWL